MNSTKNEAITTFTRTWKHADNWVFYGGAWFVREASLRAINPSEGVKAVLPQAGFSDVSFEGDVVVGLAGDAGLLLRTSATRFAFGWKMPPLPPPTPSSATSARKLCKFGAEKSRTRISGAAFRFVKMERTLEVRNEISFYGCGISAFGEENRLSKNGH